MSRGPETPIGVAFIGAGAVAEMHHQALQSCPGARLVGFYRPNQAAREERARAWGVKAYRSPDELLSDPAIDAVFVLSPVENHHEQAIQALRAGKHVLVEKPVSLSVESIREIDREARAAGRVCMPAHNYIYQPDLWRARRLIANGDLGTICAAWVNFILYHSEELASHYPGVLRQIMTHHVYVVLYLLGRPERVTAFASRLHYRELDREDQVTIVLQMPGGAQVHLFASFAMDDATSNPWSFLVKVLGTNGGTQYSWRDAVFNRPLGTLPLAYVPYEESYTLEDQHFVERCVRAGEAPLSTMEDAAWAQVILDCAAESIATERAIRVPDTLG
jgi:predicted dehydrogenase